jgi:hypothetical protein
MTQQLELDLREPSTDDFNADQEDSAVDALTSGVVLPFRKPVLSVDTAWVLRKQEADARVYADLELVRLFM